MTGRIRKLVDELRTRSVFRATVAYCVFAWMLLQVADVTFDRLPLPDNAMTVLIVLVIAGLPITIVLAWAYEFTLQGIVRHEVVGGRKPKLAFVPYVVVVAAVTAGVGFSLYQLSLRLWEPDRPAIAVLPLQNLSTLEDTEYFSDGLTEEIRRLIVRLDEFRVVALSPSFDLKDSGLDYPTVARRLGADVLLHGSVRRSGEQVRVNAQLIDGDDGAEIWSESYDRRLADVFAIQESIARQVAGALHVALPVDVEQRLANLGTRNIEAYDLYLRGLDYLRKPQGDEALARAGDYVRQAISIDPQFGKAYAALCEVHLATYEMSRDAGEFAEAEKACYRALTRDATAGDVHIALGRLYYSSGQYSESVQQYQQARQQNFGSAEAYIGLGQALIALNRLDEAEESLQQAIQLDPAYWAGFKEMGDLLFRRGRFLDAAEYYRDFARRAEDDASAYNNLGAAYYLAGDFAAAAEAWDRSLAIKPSRSAYSNTGTMYFYLGDFATASERFARAAAYAPRDHRLWGNLADAYYYTEDMRHVARVVYEQAIEFAEERLGVNPVDNETRAILAHFYSRIGEERKARQLIDEAAAAAPGKMYVQYYAALVYTQLGETDNAMIALRKAVALDYQPLLLRLDPGLDALREDAGFQQLVAASGP